MQCKHKVLCTYRQVYKYMYVHIHNIYSYLRTKEGTGESESIIIKFI